MGLKEDISDFLRDTGAPIGQAIGKLDFTFDNFRVDPEGYRRLGHLVLHESIKILPVEAKEGAKIAAAYTPGLNQFGVPTDFDVKSVGRQATVIHEMTHALIDYHVYKTTDLLDEAIAYVADAVFVAALGKSVTSPDKESRAILTAAADLVGKRKMVATRGVKLKASDKDVSVLTDAIAAHSSYNGAGGRPNYANGIPLVGSTLIDPWYEPRYENAQR